MKKMAYIIVISLAFLGFGCGGAGQNAQAPTEGYGANETGLEDDNQDGAGQINDSNRGVNVTDNGGNMNNTTSTDDTLHHLGDVGQTDAARATEKTQEQVGNTHNRGETNRSKSRTTRNEVIKE